MIEIFEQIKTERSQIQTFQAEQADKHWWKGIEMIVGDRAWIDARNISTKTQSKRLDWKYLGPQEISEVISPWAYPLNLPKDLHIHPVQPISHLNNVSEDPLLA
jgi:hypothetical protein